MKIDSFHQETSRHYFNAKELIIDNKKRKPFTSALMARKLTSLCSLRRDRHENKPSKLPKPPKSSKGEKVKAIETTEMKNFKLCLEKMIKQ